MQIRTVTCLSPPSLSFFLLFSFMKPETLKPFSSHFRPLPPPTTHKPTMREEEKAIFKYLRWREKVKKKKLFEHMGGSHNHQIFTRIPCISVFRIWKLLKPVFNSHNSNSFFFFYVLSYENSTQKLNQTTYFEWVPQFLSFELSKLSYITQNTSNQTPP